MKYQKVLAMFAIMMAAVVIPQDAVAKDKKVKYLGHQYNGAVDNNKVPAGNGVMNVGGLIIEGTFDDHSATDACVERTPYLGTQTTRFDGTVTYDESDNIVLKAGGIITTEYFLNGYKVEDGKPEYVKETLKEDRVVNSDNFEPKELNIPYTFTLDVPQSLNPPIVTGYYAAPLEKYSYKTGSGVSVTKTVFIDNKPKGKANEVKGYKDDQGRIWDYKEITLQGNGFTSGTYTVKYPNGSFYSKRYEGNNFKYKYEIHYPDGKVLKFNENDFYDLGNSFYVFRKGDSSTSYRDFISNMKKTTIKVNASNYAYSDNYDFSTLSSKEGDKIIQEHLVPFLESPDQNLQILNSPRWADGDAFVGNYSNGKYISKVDRDKADEAGKAAEDKKYEAEKASFKKKYGFDPYDSWKTIVKAGRPFATFNAWTQWMKQHGHSRIKTNLSIDDGASKCYNMIETDYGKTIGFMWVKNGVISSVSWY